MRARLSRFWYGDDVHKPTGDELEEAAHHHGARRRRPHPDEHKGIETGGQVGGDEFELEESGSSAH